MNLFTKEGCNYPVFQLLHTVVIHQNGIHFENGGHFQFENVPDNPIFDVPYDSLNVVMGKLMQF